MSDGATLHFFNVNTLSMKRILLTLILLVGICVGCTTSDVTPRNVEDFNFDWSFTLGDKKAYSQADYNDSDWRQLHLPHDWSIEGEFSRKNPATVHGGALPTGIGWYRKSFVTPNIKDKVIYIEFDGIFRNSTIYINGEEVDRRPSGYNSMSYNITRYLKPEGETNIIAVRVDNSMQPASRWYTGSGIYRNVRLVTTSEIHVDYSGTHITTPSITNNEATVHTVVTINNLTSEDREITLRNTILNKRGKEEKSRETSATIKAGESLDVEMDIVLESPTLWDVTNPYLYTMQSIVMVEHKAVDEYNTRFGIRQMEFKADTGFWLNGQNMKIKGVCLHHDLGALGSAVHRRAIEREIEIIKSMGVNAIRTAHNPPSPQLLDVCDEQGILVIDEAFDTWQRAKAKYDYSRHFNDWWEQDLEAFIKRDRNHPSIIAWSIGNAVQEQWEEPRVANPKKNKSVQLTRRMVDVVKRKDSSRPVTAALSKMDTTNNLLRSNALDIVGINYNEKGYDSMRAWYSNMPIIATESAAVFNNPEAWYLSHEEAWIAVRDREYVAGTFIWSAFDYLGEPTPYSWPARSSRFGLVDLAGFPKDIYYMYRSEWTSEPTLHLFPHWNWKEGDKVDICAYYNNADEVELFVNDKSLGRSTKTEDRLHAAWTDVDWEAGEITAIAYKDGKEVMRHTRKSATEADRLKMSVDRSILKADGYDLAYIAVECLDADDNLVSAATNQLYIDIEGAGELMGVDNGNPQGGESLKGSKIKLYNGRALIIVRTLRDIPGSIRVKVRGDGVGDVSMILTSK